MDTCEPSCCHDHQQQQQRYRHRLPSGDSALPKQISSSKNCWGPNPLITSTWNQIMVPESAARYNWCTWNKPRSSLLHPPPLPPSSVWNIYIRVFTPRRDGREMSRQGRHGLSSLPGLFASRSITPAILLPPPHSFPRHTVSFLFLSCHLHCEERLPPPSLGGVKQSRRDEKQRCCTRNSETPEEMDFNYSATAGAEWDISCCINRLVVGIQEQKRP